MSLPPPEDLVLAFVEDSTVELFLTREAACRAFEGIDVESGVVAFYTVDGIALEPRFHTPNEKGRLFGLRWVTSGAYELVPNAASAQDPLALALHEASSVQPNPWFANLQELIDWLRRRGVSGVAGAP